MKRAFEGVLGPSCPCCVSRVAFAGSVAYAPEAPAEDLCATCGSIDAWADLPPFEWPTTPEEIRASTAAVIEAATANLDAVAAAEAPLTYDNVIRPLVCAPNFKTNHLVCQSKFLQHGSADASVEITRRLPPL